jgi:hypothetical protein
VTRQGQRTDLELQQDLAEVEAGVETSVVFLVIATEAIMLFILNPKPLLNPKPRGISNESQ